MDEANNLSSVLMGLDSNENFILKNIGIFLPSEKDMLLSGWKFLKNVSLGQDLRLG